MREAGLEPKIRHGDKLETETQLTTQWGWWAGHTEATKKNGTGRGTKLNDLQTRNLGKQINTQK